MAFEMALPGNGRIRWRAPSQKATRAEHSSLAAAQTRAGDDDAVAIWIQFCATLINMLKPRSYNIADSNIANLGTDLEKKVREAAAHKEPAWEHAGQHV